jgi:hypothetical protein
MPRQSNTPIPIRRSDNPGWILGDSAAGEQPVPRHPTYASPGALRPPAQIDGDAQVDQQGAGEKDPNQDQESRRRRKVGDRQREREEQPDAK